LFAVFPALSLFSAHSSHVAFGEVLLPAAATLGLVMALWIVLWPILRNPRKRGLAVTACLVAVFAYGPGIDATRRLAGHKYSLTGIPFALGVALLLLAAAVVLFWLRRTQRDLGNVTRFLNRTAMIALLIPASVVAIQTARREPPLAEPAPPVPAAAAKLENPPNIYYIILDAYARADILSEQFHYDNAPFLTALKDRGFFVASNSYANYNWTYLSASCVLNMEYLDALAERPDAAQTFDTNVEHLLWHSKVAAFLKANGYTTVACSTGYSSTDAVEADIVERPAFVVTEFQNVFINLTPIRTALGRMEDPWQYFLHRQRLLFVLDRLPEIYKYGAPLFVFSHIMAPHPPFVLDAEGRAVRTDRPFKIFDGEDFFGAGGTGEEYVRGYTQQLSYLNTRVLQIVDAILAATPNSVIILMADHGSRLHVTFDPESSDLKEAFAIFNACFLPGADAAQCLYDTISPVNMFPEILNHYFATNFPLQPDRSFFRTGQKPYKLLDVTDRRHGS
jgi:phosphoglycerol transferase MdoB-like AlkP superfamily enzyme